MKNLIIRAGAAAASVSAIALLVAPVAMAQDCTLAGNGAFSHNHCSIKVVTKTTTKQINNATVVNTVNVTSKTGGNSASFNTGGDTSITSGESSVSVTIENNVNSNSMP